MPNDDEVFVKSFYPSAVCVVDYPFPSEPHARYTCIWTGGSKGYGKHLESCPIGDEAAAWRGAANSIRSGYDNKIPNEYGNE